MFVGETDRLWVGSGMGERRSVTPILLRLMPSVAPGRGTLMGGMHCGGACGCCRASIRHSASHLVEIHPGDAQSKKAACRRCVISPGNDSLVPLVPKRSPRVILANGIAIVLPIHPVCFLSRDSARPGWHERKRDRRRAASGVRFRAAEQIAKLRVPAAAHWYAPRRSGACRMGGSRHRDMKIAPGCAMAWARR